MTRPLILLAWAVVVATAAAPIPAHATEHEVEASELLANPDEWDRRPVAVTGELVGDYSPRDDGVWVQLNDDPFVGAPIGAGGTPDTTNIGIGARVPTDVFAQIDGPPGRYGQTGPIVRMEGIFIHSDPALQGETYIAVDAATTITPAEMHPTPGPDIWLPVGLVLLSVAGMALYTGRADRREPEPADDARLLTG